jgi:histone H3/H4
MAVEEMMAKKNSIPNMITATKAKEFAKSIQPEVRVSGDFIDALNNTLAANIEVAVARAAHNNRKTLKPCDV